MLDTSRGVLLENNVEVDLRPQSVMVLQVLLEKHGRLVSKDELHTRVWGRKAVTGDSLTQCLVDIRRALHDTDRSLIRTLPRRGYMLEADVSIESPAHAAATPPVLGTLARRASAAAIIALVAWFGWSSFNEPASPPSIAVLPLDDLSAGQDLQFIADGLAEDVLNTLAQYPEISVVARTSSFVYPTGTSDVKTIARALNVEFIVEGSIRDLGDDTFRIVAQLIETDGGTHVWSEAFEVGVSDLPTVHARISDEVRLRIAPEIDARDVRIVVPGLTSDELILIARNSERQLRDLSEIDPDLLANAVQRYRDAVSVNPDSAKAHVGLARVLLISGEIQGARQAIETAIELDGESSEVQEVFGRYLWLTGQPGAGAAWEKAVELGPSNADAHGSYGYWVWMQGGLVEAERYLARALEIDPRSLSRYADLGNYLGNESRVDDVLELAERTAELFDSAESFRAIAHMLDMIGRKDESIAWLVRARDKDPENPVYNWALAELFVDIGDFATAERLDPGPALGLLLKMGRYAEFIDAAEDRLFEDPGDLALRYKLAFAYNATGEHRLAIWQLDRSGVRDFIKPEVRQIIDLAALYVWIDAMYATGQVEAAGETVEHLSQQYTVTGPAGVNWWRVFHGSCLNSILGNDEIALQGLELISESIQMPFLYLVRDAHCVQKFKGQPRFAAVIADIESRQQETRQRLPKTLARFGVDLPEMR